MGVLTEYLGHVAVVTLDWPSTRNALGPDEVVELAGAVDAAGRAPGVVSVVITGAGAFCSGGDLKKISALTRELSAEEITDVVYSKFQSLIVALEQCPIPTIAAVDGAAIGLGMDLALACDIRIVGPGGYLAQGWGAAGLITGTGGVAFLEGLAPGLTWQLLASRQRLSAADCVEHRIAIASTTRALERAQEISTQLAALPDQTRRAYVSLTRPLRWPTPEFLRSCAKLQGGLLASETFAQFVAVALAPRQT